MEKKESLEPKKRVSWGTTDIKYFYAVDDRQPLNSEGEGSALGQEDTTENALEYNSAGNESVSPYFAPINERDIRGELNKEFDRNLFEMDMASILEEGRDTGDIRDVLDIFEKTASSGREVSMVENHENRGAGISVDKCMAEQGWTSLRNEPSSGLAIEKCGVRNRRSEEPSRVNLSFISNSTERETINVEEIINTVDVRKMVGISREDVKLSEELAKHGVRFYYQMAVNNKRRDTVSKSTTKPVPSLLLYYRNFLNVRIDYFNEFTGFLEQKMSEEDENIKYQEQLIDLGILKEAGIGSKLKKLKQACRTKAKIKWYEIRKARELDLSSKITGNKNKLIEEFSALSSKNVKIVECLNETQEDTRRLETKILGLRSKMNVDLESQTPESLEKMIREQRMVMESCRKELSDVSDAERGLKAEFDDLTVQKKSLEDEIRMLESSIKNKCIGESELNDSRRNYQSMESVFDIEILDLKQKFFRVRIGEYICNFGLEYESTSVITEYSIDVREVPRRFIHCLFIRQVDLKNEILVNAIRKVAKVNALVRSILKEVRKIEVKHDVCIAEEKGILSIDVQLSGANRREHDSVSFKVKGLGDAYMEFRGERISNLPEYGFITHGMNVLFNSH